MLEYEGDNSRSSSILEAYQAGVLTRDQKQAMLFIKIGLFSADVIVLVLSVVVLLHHNQSLGVTLIVAVILYMPFDFWVLRKIKRDLLRKNAKEFAATI